MKHIFLVVLGSALVACVGSGPSQTGDSSPQTVEITELRAGLGKPPTEGQVVRVHYVGRLPDGRVFDDTRKTGQPLEFRLGAGQVLHGLEDGLKGMSPGGKRQLSIPAAKAYGAHGLGDLVPPNTDIRIELEYLGSGAE